MGPLRAGNEIELTPVRSTRTAASSSFAPAEIGCRLVTKSPTADTASCEAHPDVVVVAGDVAPRRIIGVVSSCFQSARAILSADVLWEPSKA